MFNKNQSSHLNEAVIAVVVVAIVAALAGGFLMYKQSSAAPELPQTPASQPEQQPTAEQPATTEPEQPAEQPAPEQQAAAPVDAAARTAQLDRAMTAIGSFPDALTTTAFSADDPAALLEFAIPESLQNAVNAFENEGFGASFVLYDLNTGKGLYRDADASYWSASTVKAPFVTYVAQNLLDTGAASKEDVLQETETVSGTGVMFTDDKTEYPLSEVLENTIEYSDNTGYLMLWNAYRDGLPDWAASVGANDSSWATEQYPFYSPRTVAQLWCGIDRYLNAGAENSAWLRGVFDLSSDSFIRTALSDRTAVKEVMSKPGFNPDQAPQLPACLHDAGVVSTDTGDYVVAIMTTCPYDSTGDTHYGAYLEALAAALDDCRNQLIA